MILDQLANFSNYQQLHPLFPRAFQYLASFDRNTPDGRYELSGNDLLAMVERYLSKPVTAKEWEAHNVYGDIQIVVHGCEQCGHAERSSLTVLKPYNPEKDVEKFLPPSTATSFVILKPLTFAIFYPQDAHQPSISVQAPEPVLKVVIKFRLDFAEHRIEAPSAPRAQIPL